MILIHALQILFPDADYRTEIILQDDGEGAYIAAWHRPEPQSTPAELEAAWETWQAGALDRAKAAAFSTLNTWRGTRRVALGLTEANFQELVYTGKVLESQRWLSAPESPFGLASEAAARGITNEAMAALVLAQWSAWQSASDAIEAAYIIARLWIEAAEDEEEIARVLAGLK